MKKTFILVLIVMALLVTAQTCQTGEQKGSTKTNTFVGGTRALSILFVEDGPPDEVTDKGNFPFPVEIKLLNVGETLIKSGDVKVSLSGMNPSDYNKDPTFFTASPQEDVQQTYLDSEGNVIDPSDVYVTFPDFKYVKELTGNFNAIVRADVCYKYQTRAVAEGCIRKDVVSTTTDSVCKVKEIKKVFNSGAPIQITKFEELPSGTNKIRYLFTIKHVGTGKIYSPRNPSCDVADRDTKNKIDFKIESSVTGGLSCTGFTSATGTQGEVVLREGEQVIRCVQNTESTIDFVDRITITMDYVYSEWIEKNFLVKKSD